MFFKKIYLYLFLSTLVWNSNIHCISPRLKNLIVKKDSKRFIEYLSKIIIDQPAIKELHNFINNEIDKSKKEQKSIFPGRNDFWRVLTGSALIAAAYYSRIKLLDLEFRNGYFDNLPENSYMRILSLREFLHGALCFYGGWIVIKGLLKSDNHQVLNELEKMKKIVSSKLVSLENKLT